MMRISSSLTVVNKWVFPALWSGFLLFFMLSSWRDGAMAGEPVALLAPLAMLVAGLLVFRWLVWDLADAVHDHGSFLVVRRRGTEVQLPLQSIRQVRVSTLTSPQRITLRLDAPSPLGTEISFAPSSRLSLNPFVRRNAIADALTERVRAARAPAQH